MKKFSRHTKCKKCGGLEASIRYVDKGYRHGDIKRECRRCGYTWYERPLDAQSEEEGGK